jgi:uridine kinase/predicted NAD-dependent protein-ADP-ribosyltransferase YbiA (DUF1768 family)
MTQFEMKMKASQMNGTTGMMQGKMGEHMNGSTTFNHPNGFKHLSSAPIRLSKRLPDPCIEEVMFPDPRRYGSSNIGVVAFSYPGQDDQCDTMCNSSFLGNFFEVGPGNLKFAPPNRNEESFNNAEAAFQALRFWQKAAMFSRATGAQAYELAKQNAMQEDETYAGFGSAWNGMFAVLQAKFAPGSDFADALMKTGEAYLLYCNNCFGDSIWSNGESGEGGQNLLGMQLMLIRDELNERSMRGQSREPWGQFINTACGINLRSGMSYYSTRSAMWQKTVKDATMALTERFGRRCPPPEFQRDDRMYSFGQGDYSQKTRAGNAEVVQGQIVPDYAGKQPVNGFSRPLTASRSGASSVPTAMYRRGQDNVMAHAAPPAGGSRSQGCSRSGFNTPSSWNSKTGQFSEEIGKRDVRTEWPKSPWRPDRDTSEQYDKQFYNGSMKANGMKTVSTDDDQGHSSYHHVSPSTYSPRPWSPQRAGRRQLLPDPRLEQVMFSDPRFPGASKIGVLAFHYPGREDHCDTLCKASFLSNFFELTSNDLKLTPPNRAEVSFSNAEAAFQALKFWDKAFMFSSKSASQAQELKKEFARSEDWTYAGFGSNWKGMCAVLRAKFRYGTEIADALMRTGETYIMDFSSAREGSKNWSNNSNPGDSQNWLGMQLMLLRDELNEKSGRKANWRDFILGTCGYDQATGRSKQGTGNDVWQRTVKDAIYAVSGILGGSTSFPGTYGRDRSGPYDSDRGGSYDRDRYRGGYSRPGNMNECRPTSDWQTNGARPMTASRSRPESPRSNYQDSRSNYQDLNHPQAAICKQPDCNKPSWNGFQGEYCNAACAMTDRGSTKLVSAVEMEAAGMGPMDGMMPGYDPYDSMRFQSPQSYASDKAVIIGITGCTRCGKGWLSKELQRVAASAGKRVALIGQDEFWLQARQLHVQGKMRVSYEDPECFDHRRLATAIKEKMGGNDLVIVEGCQLLHDRQVADLFHYTFLLQLGKFEAKHRRTQQRDIMLNPNPVSKDDFDEVLWPAHERYMKEKIEQNSQVMHYQSPKDPSELDRLVDRIMDVARLSARKDGSRPMYREY